jgi:tripartite-type tricarboxylate transporter receptor subunit TctC
VIEMLEAAIRKTAESPEFTQAAERLGVRSAFTPATAFGEQIAKEDATMAVMMDLIGLKKQP